MLLQNIAIKKEPAKVYVRCSGRTEEGEGVLRHCVKDNGYY